MPAAGKLTVARALSATYGLKVLDNHLSFVVALSELGSAAVRASRTSLRKTASSCAASLGIAPTTS